MARKNSPRQSALPSSNGWADSSEAWAAHKRHRVVMPSGTKAVIEIPMLGPLALANAVPDDLAELARTEVTHLLGVTGFYAEQVAELVKEDEQSQERIVELTAKFGRLLKWLVAEHVLVEPKLTVEELSDERFPIEDLDWLYGVAVRQVSEDALGRRLGVARLDELATFRQEHGCPEDCEHCLAALDAHSTADVGAL